MNVLFMIGNGFDLNVGLKTGFPDFLPVYVELPSDNDYIAQFKKTIKGEGIKNWSNFEARLGKYAEEFAADTSDNLILCRDNFLKELVNYLKQEESKIDFPSRADEIRTGFTKSITNYYAALSPVSEEQIKTVYARCANVTHHYNFISFNYTGVLDNCVRIVKSQQKAVIQHFHPNGSVMVDKMNDVLHIHGTVDKHPILGVDNISQIINSSLAADKECSRLLLKTEQNNALRNRNNNDGYTLIEKSAIICVFGMSIGETDETWWKKLGQWLMKDDSRQLIFIDVEDGYSESQTTQSIRIRDRIISRFCDRAYIPEDKRDICEQRIHVALNTDIFKINLTDTAKLPSEK